MDSDTVFELFDRLEKGSRQIGFFDQLSGKWIRTSFVNLATDGILLTSKKIQELPDHLITLGMLIVNTEEIYSFITPVAHAGGHDLKIPFPSLMMKQGTPDDRQRRENYRVSRDHRSDNTVEVQPLPETLLDKWIQTEFINISAGGIGIAADRRTLQQLGTHHRFRISFDMRTGLEEITTPPEPEDLLVIVGHLRNARALRSGSIHMGLAFLSEDNGQLDMEPVTTRLLKYVAARQRLDLKRMAHARYDEFEDFR